MKCLFDGDSVYLHQAATSCSCVCSCVFLCVLVCALVCSCVFLCVLLCVLELCWFAQRQILDDSFICCLFQES